MAFTATPIKLPREVKGKELADYIMKAAISFHKGGYGVYFKTLLDKSYRERGLTISAAPPRCSSDLQTLLKNAYDEFGLEGEEEDLYGAPVFETTIKRRKKYLEIENTQQSYSDAKLAEHKDAFDVFIKELYEQLKRPPKEVRKEVNKQSSLKDIEMIPTLSINYKVR